MNQNLFVMVNKDSPKIKECPNEENQTVVATLKLPHKYINKNLDNYSNKLFENISVDLAESNSPLKISDEENSSPKLIKPQKYAMTLLTKFKRFNKSENCYDIKINEITKKPYVEILGFKKDPSNRYWMIPSGHIRESNGMNKESSIIKMGFKCPKKNELTQDKYDLMREFYKNLFTNSKIVYKGYLNDGRNNEDSWIEVIAENCHHYSEDIPDMISKTVINENGQENFCLKWLDISDKDFYPPHRIVLKSCAEYLNAEWID
ncbi:unnamed protein product [Brachionus calyciflorus]|uniref:Nudix hydrolase domain-containing protein n=1 Tax=Brachionus calyciflorus TaxID=104777 RepID=A0A813XN77_9BILA|nr:unnamed protein product [Brachionus calyciflorus]